MIIRFVTLPDIFDSMSIVLRIIYQQDFVQLSATLANCVPYMALRTANL